MIASDQPDFLPVVVRVRVSSRADGTMLDRSGTTELDEVLKNRYDFCETAGMDYDTLVHQVITYGEDQTYDHIEEVDEKSSYRYAKNGIRADALFTRTPGVGFFLPVADCVATVICDPGKQFLAILHLGRHSTLTDLLPNVLKKFLEKGSSLSDLLVWMSPSAGRASYKLHWFDHVDDPEWIPFRDVHEEGVYVDMQGFNRERCIAAGIPSKNINVSPVDTMKSSDYFSHAMGDISSRIAVIAKLV